jgi:uncharacterized SAM-binding protein YcdF (DUF218 family)/glycosyltransferase involved in cell wall biosynthesis
MHQQLATALVKSGHRVLFIENTGVRALRVTDFKRISIRIRNWIGSTRGFFDAKENLTVYSPILIPFPYSRLALFINRFLLCKSIGKWMRIEQYQPPVVISFLPTPLVQSLIEYVNSSLVIYYCANDMAGGSVGASRLRKYEDKFCSKVDAVFCISHTLLEYARKLNKRTFLFPPGVDFEIFEAARENVKYPSDLGVIHGPVIGYVGAISGVFDQALLVDAARALPEANFILIGPEVTDITLLKTCPNIRFLGKRPHVEIPYYINEFDVALIPYVKNAFTDAVYSCKLNEYLAMGVHVVATDMREIRCYIEQHGSVLDIARTKDEFVDRIRNALVESNNTSRAARISAAYENSWSRRFVNISGAIDQLLLMKSRDRLNWKSNLIKYYRREWMQLCKAVLIPSLCYVMVFNTPLVWFAGDQLAVRHDPQVTDAIVVFSGDGETSYINQSYQRRTLDAIEFYKSGYAPLILLSSGRDQTFSEVEIIRSLLINRGVPQSSIEILEIYPRSTFENVALVKNALARHGVRSILLITSPYHSRRALWVWRKAMPELVVLAPTVLDTPKESLQWSSSVDQIRIICYEYLAIAYYRFMGWL